jgi:hypothetical protein
MSAAAPAFATPLFEEIGASSIGFRGARIALPHEPEAARELDLSEPPELEEPRHVLPAPEAASRRARSFRWNKPVTPEVAGRSSPAGHERR